MGGAYPSCHSDVIGKRQVHSLNHCHISRWLPAPRCVFNGEWSRKKRSRATSSSSRTRCPRPARTNSSATGRASWRTRLQRRGIDNGTVPTSKARRSDATPPTWKLHAEGRLPWRLCGSIEDGYASMTDAWPAPIRRSACLTPQESALPKPLAQRWKSGVPILPDAVIQASLKGREGNL